MRRPATSGKYAVPKEINALKPADVDCFVKVIHANSQTVGANKHFYVYTVAYRPDPRYPTKGRHSSGKALGKIEGGKFIPNKAYLELKSTAAKPEGASGGHDDESLPGASEEKAARVGKAAANMRLDLKNIDL